MCFPPTRASIDAFQDERYVAFDHLHPDVRQNVPGNRARGKIQVQFEEEFRLVSMSIGSEERETWRRELRSFGTTQQVGRSGNPMGERERGRDMGE